MTDDCGADRTADTPFRRHAVGASPDRRLGARNRATGRDEAD